MVEARPFFSFPLLPLPLPLLPKILFSLTILGEGAREAAGLVRFFSIEKRVDRRLGGWGVVF